MEQNSKDEIPTKASRRMDQKVIFISHTHGDRELASHLKQLIDSVYSGLLNAFASSDPNATGGIRPGREWYPQIHERIGAADTLWVLVTPLSLHRPWIYWEAGMGSVLCPGGVIVVTVGVQTAEVPSPLSNLPIYDGLEANGGGIGELLVKIGDEVGMKISRGLIDLETQKWIEAASSYTPSDEGASVTDVSPEQISALNASIAAMESIAQTLDSRLPVNRVSPQPNEPANEERNRKLQQLLGGYLIPGNMIRNASFFVRALDAAPETTTLTYYGLDNDGDARVLIGGDSDMPVSFFLSRDQIADLLKLEIGGAQSRVSEIVNEIIKDKARAEPEAASDLA